MANDHCSFPFKTLKKEAFSQLEHFKRKNRNGIKLDKTNKGGRKKERNKEREKRKKKIEEGRGKKRKMEN